jgi:hypothetical protein
VHYCNGLQSQESRERSRVRKHFRNINASLLFSRQKCAKARKEENYSTFKMKSGRKGEKEIKNFTIPPNTL